MMSRKEADMYAATLPQPRAWTENDRQVATRWRGMAVGCCEEPYLNEVDTRLPSERIGYHY